MSKVYNSHYQSYLVLKFWHNNRMNQMQYKYKSDMLLNKFLCHSDNQINPKKIKTFLMLLKNSK